MLFIENLLFLTLEAAPWLLLGLIMAGLIHSWVPKKLINRHLGSSGPWPILKAALLGAPLPLCSCGVLPVALGIRKAGASRGATVSFLISTPETGVDSVAVSYALLGPVMAIVRPIAAIITAISAGLMTGWQEDHLVEHNSTSIKTDCCKSPSPCEPGTQTKVSEGIRYALTSVWDDIIYWLLLGLFFAAIVATYVPASFLSSWGSGIPAMLVMIAIGIPMYICATASTPIATGLLLAGISPGTVLVFLLAGPATNIATVGVVYKELGPRALAGYLLGVIISSISCGLLLDEWLTTYNIDINNQINNNEFVPMWVSASAALLLLICAIKPLRQKLPLLKNS